VIHVTYVEQLLFGSGELSRSHHTTTVTTAAVTVRAVHLQNNVWVMSILNLAMLGYRPLLHLCVRIERVNHQNTICDRFNSARSINSYSTSTGKIRTIWQCYANRKWLKTTSFYHDNLGQLAYDTNSMQLYYRDYYSLLLLFIIIIIIILFIYLFLFFFRPW